MMDGYWQVVADHGPRAQSVSRRVPAAGGRRRERRARRGEVRAARRVLLSQVSARARAVVLAARQPGLPQPDGHAGQPGAPAGEPQGSEVSRLRRSRLRHRRQPGHRARPTEGRSDQEPARGQPHGAPADRLDAARAGHREHRPLRARGAAAPARHVGRRGVDESLVAGTAARRGVGAAGRTAVAAGGA